jgi:hypothetical protein
VNKWLLVWLGPRIKGSGKINSLSHCTSSRDIIITIKPLILLLAQLSSSLLVSWECTRKTFLATGSTFSWTTISHKLLTLCTSRPNNKIVIYGHTKNQDPWTKFPLYPDPSPNVDPSKLNSKPGEAAHHIVQRVGTKAFKSTHQKPLQWSHVLRGLPNFLE